MRIDAFMVALGGPQPGTDPSTMIPPGVFEGMLAQMGNPLIPLQPELNIAPMGTEEVIPTQLKSEGSLLDLRPQEQEKPDAAYALAASGLVASLIPTPTSTELQMPNFESVLTPGATVSGVAGASDSASFGSTNPVSIGTVPLSYVPSLVSQPKFGEQDLLVQAEPTRGVPVSEDTSTMDQSMVEAIVRTVTTAPTPLWTAPSTDETTPTLPAIQPQIKTSADGKLEVIGNAPSNSPALTATTTFSSEMIDTLNPTEIRFALTSPSKDVYLGNQPDSDLLTGMVQVESAIKPTASRPENSTTDEAAAVAPVQTAVNRTEKIPAAVSPAINSVVVSAPEAEAPVQIAPIATNAVTVAPAVASVNEQATASQPAPNAAIPVIGKVITPVGQVIPVTPLDSVEIVPDTEEKETRIESAEISGETVVLTDRAEVRTERANEAKAKPEVDPNEALKQTLDRIDRMQIHKPISHMVIRLDPEELGSVTVHITTMGHRSDAEITATNERAMVALESGKAQLSQTLEQKGVNMHSMSFNLQDGGTQGQGQPQTQQDAQRLQNFMQANRADQPELATTSVQPQAVSTVRGELNLVI